MSVEIASNLASQYVRDGSVWEPADAGFRAWTFDTLSIVSTLTLTSGRIEMARVRIPPQAAGTITGVVTNVGVAGATLTAGQNLMALYTTSGTRLGITASQEANWTSTGVKQIAFTAPATNVPAGDYFIAFLSNGTTPISPSRGFNLVTHNGLLTTPLSSLRALRSTGTSNTDLAASIDIASVMSATGTPIWAALY